MATDLAANAIDLGAYTDFDRAFYSDQLDFQLRGQSIFNQLVTRRKHLDQGRAWVFNLMAGNDASTTARTSGAEITPTVVTDSQVTVTASQYSNMVRVDDSIEKGGIAPIAQAYIPEQGRWLRSTYDYLACTAAAASVDANQIRYVGQTARADITASNTMTLSEVRNAHRVLTRANVAPILLPDGREAYVAIVHPDVKYDLVSESSGIFEPVINMNALNAQFNVLGTAGGFLWFEYAGNGNVSSPNVNADAGSGNVDVYYTIFMGADALAQVTYALTPAQSGVDLGITPEGWALVRYNRPSTNAELFHETTGLMNVGFNRYREAAIFRVESASSKGANT